jgi:CRP/FNR family transcriptional regulator, cyclic AMP receptor protein
MSAQDPTPADRLAGTDLFRGLSRRHLKKVVELSQTVQHPPGREVATEGLGALAFHLVLDGQAKVSQDHEEIRTLGPGDYFGEISMIDGKPRSASVEAVDRLTTLVVPHPVFLRLVDEEPTFAKSLLNVLCERIREAESRT